MRYDGPVASRDSAPVRGVGSLEAAEPWALRNSRWIVIVGGALTVVLGLLAVFYLPTFDQVVGKFTGGDLQRARADVRTSGLALATGVGAATAGLLAWGRLELSRRQHQIDRERYVFDEELQSRQHDLAEQSQRIDRFARSVELLGHAEASVRLGALYALEGLARDDFDRQTVYDVISAYARTHVPLTQTFEVVESFDSKDSESGAAARDDQELAAIPPEETRTDDYEAAITICLRVPVQWSLVLDLRDTLLIERGIRDLADVNLAGASLIDCEFHPMTVARCSFLRATLTRCRFLGTRLVDCRFARSDMSACVFNEVRLVGGSLDSTNLGDSVFDGAEFDSTTSWPDGQPPDGTTHNPSLR